MISHLRPAFLILVAGLISLAISGCSQDAKKNQHLAAADRYFTEGDYDRAEIEYRNVRQIESLNPQAIGQLSIIYFDQGRTSHAIPYLLRSREVQPDNLDLQLKLAQIYQAVGKNQEAQEEAWAILDKRPEDPEAPIVIAGAAASEQELNAARERFQKLPEPIRSSAPIMTALGIIDLRDGKFPEAEKAFKDATNLDGNYAPAYAALGSVYGAKNDIDQADHAFAAAARLSPERSSRRLQYVQFKMQYGAPGEARKMLEEITQKYPDQLPAWMLLAHLAASEKKYAESEELVAKVLARDDSQPEALLLDAQLKLFRNDFDAAFVPLEVAARLYPHWQQVHYQYGLTYLAKGDLDKAVESLSQAVTIAPGFHDAAIVLAELELRKGNYSVVILSMQRVVQVRPDFAQAWLLMAEAYRRQGNPDDALGVYGRMEKLFPKFSRPPLLTGLILAGEGKRDAARDAFNRALIAAPDSLAVIEQLANLDLAEKKFPAARERANTLINKDPKQSAPYLLLGKIELAQNHIEAGEAALLKAIELQPDDATPYMMLAGVYLSAHEQDKAMIRLQEAATKSPRNPVPVMMMAIIDDMRKNYAGARDNYEKVLAISPKTNMALNNLAFLYSEKFNQLDKAYELAQRAYDTRPQEPNTADTLGWILYKKKAYARAGALLTDSAAKLPNSADIQFHLGMTQYMLGNEFAAVTALQRALELDPNLTGKTEAKDRLGVMAIDAKNITPADRAALEKHVADQPEDIVATSRLGSAYERAGESDKAIDAFEIAVRANPKNPATSLKLIQLYAARRDTIKAIELGNDARRLMPKEVGIVQALGRLAYETGDYKWSASMFQEAASQLPASAEAQYEYGQSAYAVGQVSTSIAAMQDALKFGLSGLQKEKAVHFLELAPLQDSADDALAASTKLDEALKADPTSVPALMARGKIAEQKRDPVAARKNYEKVLERYPTFVPAMKRLALIYINNPADTQLAFSAAAKARDSLPKDPELAKVLGIALYRQNDFDRATTFLTESAAVRPEDAELQFYLGMAQFRVSASPESRQMLQRAIELGLPAPLSAEARKALEERK
ncbi:MAG: uncharacterized protein JWM32_547 [Verrucomicrobia bacterium]|nr:uncharacterized protein [Verrucomicrobiota bacterium]